MNSVTFVGSLDFHVDYVFPCISIRSTIPYQLGPESVQNWYSIGAGLVRYWFGVGAVLVRYWYGIVAVLARYWYGIGAVLARKWYKIRAKLYSMVVPCPVVRVGGGAWRNTAGPLVKKRLEEPVFGLERRLLCLNQHR